VTPNTYVTIIGEVVHLDQAEIGKKGAELTKEYKPDFPADVVSKYKGHPVVLAKSVITTAGVDVAKRPPPPMTAEEEALSKIMKQIASPRFHPFHRRSARRRSPGSASCRVRPHPRTGENMGWVAWPGVQGPHRDGAHDQLRRGSAHARAR
jgi:hypothetical protein